MEVCGKSCIILCLHLDSALVTKAHVNSGPSVNTPHKSVVVQSYVQSHYACFYYYYYFAVVVVVVFSVHMHW